jgi:hypothetical protein
MSKKSVTLLLYYIGAHACVFDNGGRLEERERKRDARKRYLSPPALFPVLD